MDRKLVVETIAYKLNSGYWSAGDRYFFDKRACLEHASKIKSFNVQFHWFDSAFQSLDWNKPPTQSLDQLYLTRAQQIRDKYSYVVLAFSGGADSTNVLDTFLENNIQLDEIVCYYPVEVVDKLLPTFDANDKGKDKCHFEYKMACEPKLQQVANQYPNIKITVLDFTRDSQQLVSSSNAYDMNMAGMSISPILAGHVAVAKRLRNLAEQGHNVGCIFAVDKPRLLFNKQTKKFGAYFSDFSTIYCKTDIDGYRPNIEPFYWSPDLPELFRAQCYLVKQAIEPYTRMFPRPEWCEQLYDVKYVNVDILNVHTDFVKRILYKNFNPNLWQTEKTSSLFYHDNCSWFWSELTDSRTKDFYDGQLKEWLNGIDPKLILYKNNRPDRFIDLYSKIYWL